MADLTITAANVLKTAVAGYTASEETVVAGATITAGQTVYLDSTDSNKAKLADANASQATAQTYGIALHAALSGQPLRILRGGPLSLGTILTRGLIYVQSATAGGIAPSADLASGHYSTILGWAYSTSVLIVNPIISDVALA